VDGDFHDNVVSSEMITALIMGLALGASFDATLDASLTPPLGGKVFRSHSNGGTIAVRCPETNAWAPVDVVMVLTVAADGSGMLLRQQRNCSAVDRRVTFTANQTKVFAPLFDATAYRGFSEQPCLDGSPTIYEMAAGDQRATVEFQCAAPVVLSAVQEMLEQALDSAKTVTSSAH
jgi:hypothetical protein